MSIYLGNTPLANTGYDKANTDLSNLTNTGKNIANWSNNVTNCITEIPQDIKLELNNGTLTLKAGSKVYVPNGSGVFNVVTIASDIAMNGGSASGTEFVYVTANGASVYHYLDNSSGTDWTATSQYQCRYNTNENMIKNTNDTGSTWLSQLSFPFARVKLSSGTVTSIEQVFNGFGYIGSTVFALPGVKGLIPNGRNDDGSLKNIETNVSSVSILTLSSSVTLNGNGRFLLSASGEISARIGSYDEKNNYVLAGNGVDKIYGCVFADNCTVTSGVINTLNIKTAFHALDYNDLSEVQCVIETYVNGSSWYRIWSADSTGREWVEQGGFATRTGATQTVTFPKKFSDTNYNIQISARHTADSTDGRPPLIRGRTTTSFTLNIYTSYEGAYWYACGYGA